MGQKSLLLGRSCGHGRLFDSALGLVDLSVLGILLVGHFADFLFFPSRLLGRCRIKRERVVSTLPKEKKNNNKGRERPRTLLRPELYICMCKWVPFHKKKKKEAFVPVVGELGDGGLENHKPPYNPHWPLESL